MPWIHLLLAGLFEIAWAISLKSTDGWTRLWPSLATIALMAVSFTFLSLALRTLPIGTAYAVWTGIGALGTVVFGIVWLGEPATWTRGLCVAAIVGGIVGLKVSSAPPPPVPTGPLAAERSAEGGEDAARR